MYVLYIFSPLNDLGGYRYKQYVGYTHVIRHSARQSDIGENTDELNSSYSNTWLDKISTFIQISD